MNSEYNFLRKAVLDHAIDTSLRREALDRLLLHLKAIVEIGSFLIPLSTYNEATELIKKGCSLQATLLLKRVMDMDTKTARKVADCIEMKVKAKNE